MKHLIVLIGEIKYPTAPLSYLTADAYIVGNSEDRENAIADFKEKVESDGFKIVNFLVFVPHIRPLLSIGAFQLIWNAIRKPQPRVRYDAGENG